MSDALKILDQAREHFSRVMGDGELDVVVVPEWGNAKLYFHRAMNINSKSRILAAQAEGGLKHMAQIVIECARDEDGKKMFNPSRHMDTLMKEVDSNVVIRIAGEMAAALVPEEDVPGKFDTTRSSESDT